MKKLSLLLTIISLSVMLVFLGCKKDPPPDLTPTNGQAMFWVASDFGCGNITVTLNGISKAITGFSGTGSPTCGAGEAATFEIAPGTYTYSTACNSKTWNGTVTITSGSCSKIELTGGVAATGQTMFWIASDLGCGNITVTCNGVSKEITGYSSNGVPACGTNGTATFDFAPGTYTYSAKCSGKTWNGNVTITASGCSKTQLTGDATPATGQALFWTASDLGCGNITVTINGVNRTISSFYSSGAPACGANGAATFDLAPGTYSYSAQCNSKTWNGTVSITASGCSKIQLTGGTTPSTGQAMFWTASDVGCGNITVSINGVTRTISSYYSSGAPDCGASGTATFDFAPGTYSYSAQCSGKTWNGTVTITASGCSKIQLTGGTTPSTGQAMFWTGSDLGCGNITVTVNGVSRSISSYYSSGAPACGASGAATFNFAPGTYSYSAQCSGKTWNGTVTISANGCSKIQLTGSATPSTGQAMFWAASDLRCGNITVTVNGISRTISSYYSSGAPACGATGTATFVLNPGTYSYSGRCSGKTWNGSITVSANGCSKLQFTN